MSLKLQKPASKSFIKIIFWFTVICFIVTVILLFIFPFDFLEPRSTDIFIEIFLILSIGGVLVIFLYFIYRTFGATSSVLKFHKRSLLAIILLNLLLFAPFYLRQETLNTRLTAVEEKLGGTEKIACRAEAVEDLLKNKVVRVIGSYGEGSGFPYSEQEIMTNYHVIEGEDAPKVVFPDGSIENPIIVKGDKERDLALLVLDRKMEPFNVAAQVTNSPPVLGDTVFAAGYPRGSEITGPSTILKGSFSGLRGSDVVGISYVESEIDLINGMSGGPLVDSCGRLLGVNTLGFGGLSYFINAAEIALIQDEITNENIEKFELDTSTPVGVVEAYYHFIRVKDLGSAYDLLGQEKKEDASLEEYEQGYVNTLQVNLIRASSDPKDENKVDIKIYSQDWIDGELVDQYFEGYWIVNEEMKLEESNIEKVFDPGVGWLYDLPEY